MIDLDISFSYVMCEYPCAGCYYEQLRMAGEIEKKEKITNEHPEMNATVGWVD